VRGAPVALDLRVQQYRGFSLVETLIATTLMAGTLVSLAQFIGAAAQSGAAARTRALAALMAAQKVEQLWAMPWDAIASVPAPITEFLDASGNQRCPGAGAPCGEAVFVRKWSAAHAAFSTGVLIIEVDVRPVGRGHGSATLISARGRMAP
jgi:Tfp pilus assembly protein PilV